MSEVLIPNSERQLSIPNLLLPTNDRHLPEVSIATHNQLMQYGWSAIGIMVAFVDSDGSVLTLRHNGRDKNRNGALGPLGETLEFTGPHHRSLESPRAALARGMFEEMNIHHPTRLTFGTFAVGGWAINQWPRGDAYPGQYNCAISFPVFVPDATKVQLLEEFAPSEEVSEIAFIQPDQIMDLQDHCLRPGVKAWLAQMQDAQLLDPLSRPTTVMGGY